MSNPRCCSLNPLLSPRAQQPGSQRDALVYSAGHPPSPAYVAALHCESLSLYLGSGGCSVEAIAASRAPAALLSARRPSSSHHTTRSPLHLPTAAPKAPKVVRQCRTSGEDLQVGQRCGPLEVPDVPQCTLRDLPQFRRPSPAFS